MRLFNNEEYGMEVRLDNNGNAVFYEPSQVRMDEYLRAKSNFENAKTEKERKMSELELEEAKNRIWDEF